jgi:ubiquinone/menaquinone biosynthesis C-methylase UbiE
MAGKILRAVQNCARANLAQQRTRGHAAVLSSTLAQSEATGAEAFLAPRTCRGTMAMTTDYDPIAEQYQRSKQQPWRTYIESFTLMALIGDPRGQAVLDVACGEGFYTRRLRQLGAGPVVGIDLSEGMVALARQQEARQRLGIDYRVADARSLAMPEQFDLVVAAYLLNYAPNREELQAMCRSIANSLKPGGRFVTVNSNPALDFAGAPSYRQYGFEIRVAGPCREGTPITWTFFLKDSSFSIENYYLDVSCHEETLRLAGFQEIRWHPPRLAPAAEAASEGEFWTPFLDQPPITFLECIR